MDSIRFDEAEHKYYLNDLQMEISVTGLVHEYFEKFDGQKIARLMLRGKNFWTDEDKYGKYWDLVAELEEQEAVRAIVNMWADGGAEASSAGTTMHQAIEDHFVLGKSLPDTKECRMFSNFEKHMTSLGYEPHEFEQIVWCAAASLAGSVDAQFINPDTQEIWLVDWKRSKEIKTTAYRGKKGFGPMSDKEDCNFEHYSLQLNIYKYMLVNFFGKNITRMSLVILHPNQDDYLLLDVTDNQRAVEQIMQARINRIGS